MHTGVKEFKCASCGKEFMLLSARNNHYKVIHLLQKSFKCLMCEASHTSSRDLDRHRRTHDETPLEKLFPCDIAPCEKAYAARSSLVNHIKLHHTKEHLNTCNICGKQVSGKWPLEDHLKIHNGEDRAPCKYCHKIYNRSSDLSRHIKSLHRGERQLSWIVSSLCKLCGNPFKKRFLNTLHG